MPWLRGGDNAATHPIVMRVFGLVRKLATKVLERDVAVNEVFGFVTRCALQSAGHTTDYVIDEGTAFMMGGARTERLIELARKAGYLTAHKRRGETIWRLVDIPEFIHMRTKAEIEREQQRKADNANGAITGPVRLRDGDECRYCGVIVKWTDRKSGRGGTYDHRDGLGEPATVDNMVVACQACNAGRSDDPNADTRYPLRPAPAEPYYSPASAAFLLNAGYRVAVTDDPRPGTQPDNVTRDPTPSGTTRQPTKKVRAPVTTPPDLQIPADPEHPESGFPGTGRDGTGSAAGSRATRSSTTARPRRRARRGKTTRSKQREA